MRPLVIVDTETTGLEDYHRPFEVSWLKIDLEEGIDPNESPLTFYNMLSSKEIDEAQPKALGINGATPAWLAEELPTLAMDTRRQREMFYDDIIGSTLVGANVRFDAEMLMRIMPFSVEPWHHRLFDIQAFYAGVMRRMEIPGLNDIVKELNSDNPESVTPPDHTSKNDVRAVRDILYMLLDMYM